MAIIHDSTEVVERICGERGELVLRVRRPALCPSAREAPEAVYEIISNGVFLMDSLENRSERALARSGLEPLSDRDELRVLVGGLGLGYTLREVLEEDRVAQVSVVEVEAAVVRWMKGPLKALADDPLGDPRVIIHIADVSDYLAQTSATYDAILLDVDNGPEWTVIDSNTRLYTENGLRRMRDRLSDGGVAAIWSSEQSSSVHTRMADIFGSCEEIRLPISRGSHRLEYYVYRAGKRHATDRRASPRGE